MDKDKDKDKPSHSTDVAKSPKRLSSKLSFKETDHLKNALDAIKSRRYTRTYTKKPWLDDDGQLVWSPLRVRLAKIVISQAFETIMGVIIVLNLFLIMYEADMDAKCYPVYSGDRFSECPSRSDLVPLLTAGNVVLLIIYSLESLTRAFAEREYFLYNAWNVTDLLTVVLGWLSMALVGMVDLNLLRLSRLIRVLRAARVFISIPEFYLLVSGLYSSMKAIIFGSFMLLSAIVFWAVISVELLHPITSGIEFYNCPSCNDGFKSVAMAGLTLFQQIVAGDSWGQISVPLVTAEPWTAAILFAMLVSISLGLMNLILAVIVERATEAREHDHDRKLRLKDQERSKNMVDFAKLCDDMDSDESGTLSLEEMLTGFEENEDFARLMRVMDIHREDMQTIFHVLDTDNSGEVSYYEFCEHLSHFFERDPAIMNSLIKYSVMELRKLVDTDVKTALRRQTDLLNKQTVLLETILPTFLQAQRHPEEEASMSEPFSLDIWYQQHIRKNLDVDVGPMEALGGIQQQLQPVLARAEDLVREALDYRDVQIAAVLESHSLPELTADAPKIFASSRSSDSILDTDFAVLCNSFEHRLIEIENLEKRCRDVVRYLKREMMPDELKRKGSKNVSRLISEQL
mmetsp:Transcript_47859/g.111824  ORF Transcript_47859/g.111824 Transcript_47859/m.111824 type:complete len:629 (-) Transcript_47859:51-1937(-)